MAEDNTIFEAQDLRAAVAAGIVNEAQAASLLALAQSRAGTRRVLPSEDEPFEFFRGFSEIFVSVGLMILLGGIAALISWLSGLVLLVVVPAIMSAIAWWWAEYFAIKRRMNLPSMVLTGAFATGIYVSALTFLGQMEMPVRSVFVLASLLTVGAMAVWYRRFKLPFSMFVLGLFGLFAIYATTASVEGLLGLRQGGAGWFFDLRNSPHFSLATLIFGLIAFAGGMWFDMRDPYRLGRHSATGFWLHMLAAPALVNTVAMTLYNIGGSAGMLATAAALSLIAILALVIDRRSFLTAGIVYIALIISWAVHGQGGGGVGHWAAILIILGVFLTALGTWWVPLRAALLRALPDFPAKRRLPPYSELS